MRTNVYNHTYFSHKKSTHKIKSQKSNHSFIFTLPILICQTWLYWFGKELVHWSNCCNFLCFFLFYGVCESLLLFICRCICICVCVSFYNFHANSHFLTLYPTLYRQSNQYKTAKKKRTFCLTKIRVLSFSSWICICLIFFWCFFVFLKKKEMKIQCLLFANWTKVARILNFRLIA